jgi:hypothetical protein
MTPAPDIIAMCLKAAVFVGGCWTLGLMILGFIEDGRR